MLEFISFLLYIFSVYAFSTLTGYLVHSFLHHKWAGFAATSHLVHHTEMYPPEDLISDKYRHAGKNTTVLLFLPIVLSILALALFLGFTGVLSIFYCAVTIVEILTISILHNLLHDAFHLNDSIWHRLPNFKKMQDIHFEHHVDMTKNFGIFDFTWDKFFETFKSVD